MKMSKGQIGRRLLGLAVVGAALMTAGGTAFAELGQPAPWEYKLQGSATQVMDDITSFHNWLLITITLITLFVLSRKEELTPGQYAFVEGGACFWHMVDLLWVMLFPLLYLMK